MFFFQLVAVAVGVHPALEIHVRIIKTHLTEARQLFKYVPRLYFATDTEAVQFFDPYYTKVSSKTPKDHTSRVYC